MLTVNRQQLLRRKFILLPKAVVSLFTGLVLVARLGAEDVELLTLAGQTTYTNYNKSGKVVSGFRGHFQLTTDYKRWNLYYAYADRPPRQQTTYDGTNTYTLFQDLPLYTNNLTLTKATSAGSGAAGTRSAITATAPAATA